MNLHQNAPSTQISHLHFINPLNTKLNSICHLLALLGAHHIFYVSWLRANHQCNHVCNMAQWQQLKLVNTTVIIHE